MATSHARVTVGTTPTRLDTAPAAGEELGGEHLRVQSPTGAVAVFVGGPGVTTTSYGHELVAGQQLAVELGPDDELYGVVATGTQVVNVLRTK